MDNTTNRAIYRLYAPIYDVAMRPFFASARRRAIDLLGLQPGERVLIPGVGTGLDLPLLPVGAHVTAADLSPAMLRKAAARASGRDVSFLVLDAQALPWPPATFDAAILNLILSVVPDGRAAFREVWRVLRPGGRVVILDKFLPEGERLSTRRRILGRLIAALGTDPNRRLCEIVGGVPDLVTVHDEPSLLRGQYRIVLLHKCEERA